MVSRRRRYLFDPNSWEKKVFEFFFVIIHKPRFLVSVEALLELEVILIIRDA